MTKAKIINSLYVVLCLYEDVFNESKSVTLKDYLIYLKRKYIYFSGRGNEEIACLIKGLEDIKLDITHDEIKSIVFHMIGIIEKEE